MAKSGGRKANTTNQHTREVNTEENQVHNSKTAHDQNQADTEHSGHKGRPPKS